MTVSALCDYALRVDDRCTVANALTIWDDRPGKLEGTFAVGESPVQLGLFHGQQDFLELGAGDDSHPLQVVPGDQLGGRTCSGGVSARNCRTKS